MAQLLAQSPDVQQAAAYLESIWSKLPSAEKPAASACLAFLYHQLGLKTSEYHWLSLHLEKYPSSFWDSAFLPSPWSQKLIDYLNYWEKNYPQLFDLAFLKPPKSPLEKWPTSLTLVVNVKATAYYKIMQGGIPVTGGRLNAGTNLVTIPLPAFSPQERRLSFLLELKKEDLLIRHQIELRQTLEAATTQYAQQPPQVTSRQFRILLYWKNKLLAQSQIIQDLKENINRDLPPRDGVFRPFGPYQEKNNPQNYGVSVFQAIKLLGDFLQKKLSSDKPGSGGKKGERAFSLSRLSPEKTRELNFFLRSSSQQSQTIFYQGSLRLQVSFQEGTALSSGEGPRQP